MPPPVGDEVAGDDQRLERLLDEERIALGEPVQQLHEVVAEVLARAEDRLQHRANVVSSKRLDGSSSTTRARSRSATSRASRGPASSPRYVSAMTTGCEAWLRARWKIRSSVASSLQCTSSNARNTGCVRASERHDLAERVEQSSPVRLGIDRRAWDRVGKKRPELGEDRDELGRRRRQDVRDERRRRRRREQSHEVEQRRVRDRPLGLETGAVQDEEARGAGFFGHGAQETRFADARLADDYARRVRCPPVPRQDPTRRRRAANRDRPKSDRRRRGVEACLSYKDRVRRNACSTAAASRRPSDSKSREPRSVGCPPPQPLPWAILEPCQPQP